MCVEITREDIKYALFEIDDNKSPDIDGFSAWFYKKIQDDIYEAVQEFFKQNNQQAPQSCQQYIDYPYS